MLTVNAYAATSPTEPLGVRQLPGRGGAVLPSGNTQAHCSVDRDGTITQGGSSTTVVVDEDFVLRIPASLDFSKVAPLLCAGITTYSPPPACTRPAKPTPITKSLGRSTHA